MKVMKRFVYILISVFILLQSAAVFAVEDKATDNTYTIEEIQKLAEDNSKQKSLDELSIKEKEEEVEEVKSDGNFPLYVSVRSEMINAEIRRADINQSIAEVNLEVARKNKEDNITKLRSDVYKTSMEVLLLGKQYDIEKQKLDILSEEYKMSKAQYDKGKISYDDFYNMENELSNKKIDVNNILKKQRIKDLELKKLLSMPLSSNTPIKIGSDITYRGPGVLDLESILPGVLEADSSIYQADNNTKVRKKILELATKYYSVGTLYYDESDLNHKSATADLENAKLSLEVDIRNKYSDLLNAKDDVELAQSAQKLCEKKYKNVEIKYTKGLVSKQTLLEEKIKKLDAQYHLYETICSFNIIKKEFESMTGKTL